MIFTRAEVNKWTPSPFPPSDDAKGSYVHRKSAYVKGMIQSSAAGHREAFPPEPTIINAQFPVAPLANIGLLSA
jgi:hypothetical protein